ACPCGQTLGRSDILSHDAEIVLFCIKNRQYVDYPLRFIDTVEDQIILMHDVSEIQAAQDVILRYSSTLGKIHQSFTLLTQFRDEPHCCVVVHGMCRDVGSELSEILVCCFSQPDLIAHGRTSSNSPRISSLAASIA